VIIHFTRWIFFFVFIFFGKGDAFAQYEIKALPRWIVSFHLDGMFPHEPIKTFLDNSQWGYHVEGQYRIQYNKPFLAGLYFSEAGLSRYVVEYMDTTQDGSTQIKEKANTVRLETGLTFGFYPEINWLLQPYIQGRFGIALFKSSSILTDHDSGELIDRIHELSTYVNSYGLDFGIHIVPTIWYFRGDVRIGVIANPSVKFLALNEEKEGTAQYPIQAFDEHISSGRWLKVSVGVSYLF